MASRLLPVLLLLLLAACTAPAPPPTPSSVPPATTGSGPAWQRPYTVMGRTYQPLPSHQGYSETGIASWYGRDFNGHKTSNGETYDMYAMTAAHKTLPLGVSVRVTNLQTGRQVVVRVNDRGPFVKGRLIDLSYAAACKLGIDKTGTGRVRVEALGYLERSSQGMVAYRAPASYDVGSFAVQVGAFNVEDNARRLAARLQARYGVVSVQQGRWRNGSIWRVWVGRYRSLREAKGVGEQLARQGFGGNFVVALN